MNKTKLWFKDISKILSMTEMTILPGQIAFFLVLSIIPIISLVAITGGVFFLSMETLTNFIHSNFPTDLSEIIIPLVSGRGLDLNFILFLFITLLLASNGAYSIIVSSNMIYGKQDTQTFLKRRIKAFILILLIILLFIFILLVPTFGEKILLFINNFEYIPNIITKQFEIMFLVLKWPITLLLTFLVIKIIYTVAPDKHIGSENVNYGAMFTSLGWILATIIYSYYITNFSYYDIFYGTLSNIIALMIWIFMLSYIFVFGMCLNSSYYYKRKQKKIKKGSVYQK